MSPRNHDDAEAWRALLAADETRLEGEDCPSADALWASAHGEDARHEDDVVLDHVTRCGRCAAAWRRAREMAGEVKLGAVRTGRRRALLLWAAAAAVLVVAVVVPSLWWRERGSAPPAYRAGERVAIAVESSPVLPRDRFVLRWSAGPRGTTYDVVVTTADLDTIAAEYGVDALAFTVHPKALSHVPNGGTVLWRVNAHLPDGRTLSTATVSTRVR